MKLTEEQKDRLDRKNEYLENYAELCRIYGLAIKSCDVCGMQTVGKIEGDEIAAMVGEISENEPCYHEDWMLDGFDPITRREE